MTITCPEYGEQHLRIHCPLRSPSRRARSFEEIRASQMEEEKSMQYHCTVLSYPGKGPFRVHSETVGDFWTTVEFAQSNSIYRDFCGVVSSSDNTLYKPGYKDLPPGEYQAVGRTIGLSDEELYIVLDGAKDVLSAERPLAEDKVSKVHDELCLVFNHFSLKHEGSQLEFSETEMITNLLARDNGKRQVEEDEIDKIKDIVPGSDHDITEAINHILVTENLQKMAKKELSEKLILKLHAAVMKDLLKNVEEGMPGEYRKVSVNIMGEDSLRPHFADIAPLMKTWVQKDLVQREGEHIVQYLSRIHSRFQDIHPFVDGNGRVGRLIMNIILLQNGYPVLSFTPETSNLFNHGVKMGTRGNHKIFSRLIAEVLFSSFKVYEEALGVTMLPSLEDSVQVERNASASDVASIVTP